MELLLRLGDLPREIRSAVFFLLHPPSPTEVYESCKSGKILLVEQWFFHDLIKNQNDAYSNAILTDALYCAARYGHTEIVSIFLSSGMNMSTETFYAACCNNHPQIISLIIDYRRPHQTNIDAALYLAAYDGHTEVMTILINNGANVNRLGALQIACQNHQYEAVSLLLEHGAIPTEEVESFLHYQ